ncbi:Clavaminate synthase-like protein [Colletotrichum sublineola]|nr:Clavaminate synthase-like protein [Colletotrichum sublineola]
MAGASAPFTPKANLDTVNFSKVLDRDPETMKTIISACENVGFFYLDLSDQYSATMLNNLDKLNMVMKDWFAQPTVIKRKELAISMASHGYKPIGSQAGTHGGRDGWEVLKTGSFELAGRWGLPPVVEDNYQTFSAFQSQCHYITRTLLDRISNTLGLRGSQSLNQFHRSDCPSKSALAFLHYIPMDPTGSHAGHNVHTDYGTITLVFAPQWGLQVLSPSGSSSSPSSVSPLSRSRESSIGNNHNGDRSENLGGLNTNGGSETAKPEEPLEWQYVEPRPGCAIVNVADVLRFLTNDRLKSAVHRVLPLPDVDRYSVTYFLRPSDDVEFIDGSGHLVNVMDWYDRKNNMYEASYAAQDRSLLIGGLYKDV